MHLCHIMANCMHFHDVECLISRLHKHNLYSTTLAKLIKEEKQDRLIKKKQFLLPFLLLSLLVSSALAGRSHHHHHHHRHHHHGRHSEKKLFVFGDSYVDTGNWNKVAGISWKPPYGLIFPGKPAGRFSDGRVLPDFVAQYFHIRSPIPYVRRNMLPNAKTQFGMNFAYGGTGVFNTYVPLPNMTVQISLFEDVISREKVYMATDLQSSIALVSLAGNDYATLRMHEPPNPEELKRFIKSVVHQLVLNVKQIHSLGVPKVVVTTLPPLGCLPITTFLFGYKNCLSRLNKASAFHNRLLKEGLNMLNKEIPKPAFFILDLYDAFLLALRGHRIPPENLKYRNPLIQCCQGVTSGHDCGSIEGNEAKYKSRAWMAMAAVEGMKYNGFARWSHPLRSLHQHLKSNIRSSSQAKKLSSPISNKIRDEKLKKSEESLRTLMYLSCWGPYN